MEDVRRVVAATTKGKSRIIDDRAWRFVPFSPGVEICELWHVREAPLAFEAANVDAPLSLLMPQPGQAVLRLVRFLPSEGQSKREENAQLAGAGDIQFKGTLHRTGTFDYSIVRKGEVWLVTESGDVRLTQGDGVILAGGFHSWENRTRSPAEIFSVMIGATGWGDPTTADVASSATDSSTGIRRVLVGHDRGSNCAILSDVFLGKPVTVDPSTKVWVMWHEQSAPPINRLERNVEQPLPLIPPGEIGSSFWKVTVAPDNRLAFRRHPTLDFIMIMEGEISYITEDAEVLLRTGDIIVQSGNSHAWRNNASADASLAVVHIGVQTKAGVKFDVPS